MNNSGTTVRRRKTRGLECFKIDRKVGSGMYGDVFKAKDITTTPEETVVALKKIKMERETQGFPVTALREIKILNMLRHENVVHLREIITFHGAENEKEQLEKSFTIGDVFMVFEYVDYDLSVLLKAKGFTISDALVKSYLHQLLTGVHYLHEKKILHRDIKGANLLITNRNVLKIADLGLARNIPSTSQQKLTNPVVTLWYRSPEVILGSQFYGPEVDLWSVGCIFAELKSRTALFNANTEGPQLELIFSLLGCPQGGLLDRYRLYPDWEKLNFRNIHFTNRLHEMFAAKTFDAMALDLLEKLLELDPSRRVKATEALAHPYFLEGQHFIDGMMIPLQSPTEFPPIDLTALEQQQLEYEQRQKQLKDEQDALDRVTQQAKQQQQLLEQQQRQQQQQALSGKTLVGVGAEKREMDKANNAKLSRFKSKTSNTAAAAVVAAASTSSTIAAVSTAAAVASSSSSSSSSLLPSENYQPAIQSLQHLPRGGNANNNNNNNNNYTNNSSVSSRHVISGNSNSNSNNNNNNNQLQTNKRPRTSTEGPSGTCGQHNKGPSSGGGGSGSGKG